MVTGIAHHFWQEIVDDRLESTGAAVNYSDILHQHRRHVLEVQISLERRLKLVS